jgi:uncharacterized membrane protein YfcA
MISAAYSMIRNNKYGVAEKAELGTFNYPMILTQGFAVGAMTGLVSVGGGFLIIPSLVLFGRVPIKIAVGTSLIIISTNAFVGFAGELHNQADIDWIFLFKFSVFSVIGIVLGSNLARHIPAPRLKPLFGWMVLLMGSYIFGHELLMSPH